MYYAFPIEWRDRKLNVPVWGGVEAYLRCRIVFLLKGHHRTTTFSNLAQ